MSEWVNETQRLSEPAKKNGNNTMTRRWQGGYWFFYFIFLCPDSSKPRGKQWLQSNPSFSLWHKLKISVPLCLFAAEDFLSFNKTYLLFNKWTPTPHFTFPQCYLPNQTQPLQDLKLGQLEGEKVSLLWNCVCKDWLWPKPQELETVCELTRHRQVQAGWGKKLLPGFSSCRLPRPLMFYVLFSWRWLINVWQQSKKG